MNLFDLYKEENKDLLYCISWLNKNSIFDKSIGEYKNIDLFTFLENISRFDYEKDVYLDDIYYMLEYTKDSILHLINNINKEIKREHEIVPISQAKEFDKTSLLWISRQNGRTLKEKLSKGKIKSVQRYKNIDTYENRIFKTFLKMLVEVYELRNDINEFEQLFIKIRRWLKTDEAKSIDEYKKIVYNNLLLHHPHYNKIFKSYKKSFNLGNKYDSYLASFPKQIYMIIKFEVLTQLQFKTNMAILPKHIEIERNSFEVELFNPLINIDLDELMKNVYKKYTNNFSLIRNFINSEIKSLATTNRTFKIDTDNIKEVFIDLFRLFPIANINNEIVNFPIILKQEIDGNIINANNTKIIDLNNEIYTLPEILDNFNVDILKYFLEDISQIFNKTKLNYIIPDYVNVFQFIESKRIINTYFKDNKPIPKSILAGLKYLFTKDVKQDDTLIYIQRNHHNELYVTPLLVKFDNKLENITQGFYLEKYPTKKIGLVDDDLLSSLNTIFDEKYSKILLNKFLQNGLKGVKKENIVFYKDNKVIDLSNLEIPLKVYDDIEKIRNLYNSKNLFNSNCKTLNDTNEENLNYFAKLLEFEKQGFRLWREHLPDLSIEINKNGVYEQFSLVNENSELIEKIVKIDNHFLIPLGVKELSFPLIFGDEKINYKVHLTSQDFPYSQHMECQLKLTYDFERENPYELTFIPLNKEYKDINAQWKKQNYKDIILPIPNYPEKKSWEDFKKDPKRDGSGYSDLLDWILERLELLKNIDEVPKFIIDKEIQKARKSNKSEGYFQWGKYDKNEEYFCFVEVDGDSVFCHSKSFKEDFNPNDFYEGMIVYLKVKENSNGKKTGQAITFTDNISDTDLIKKVKEEYLKRPLEERLQSIINAIRSITYPLLIVWNNHSLTDPDVPDYFREHMYKNIELSLNYMKDKSVPIEFKKELFNFLSHLNQDMPVEIANTLVKYSKDLKYSNNLALAIGNADLDWQEQVLENIFNHFNKYPTDGTFFDILAIALWRSEILISKVSRTNIEKVILNLVTTIQNNFKTLKEELNRKNIGQLIKKIELLLGILRARSKFDFLFPHESLTLEYIKILDEITKYVINENINLKTRIKLDIVKPDSFFKVPDILYAIRVYLTADTGAANSIKVLGVSDD